MSYKKVKYTIKITLSAFAVGVLIGCFSYHYYMKPDKSFETTTEKISGSDIYVSGWKFGKDYGKFEIESTGIGKAETTFGRPQKWQFKKNKIIINLGLDLSRNYLTYGGDLLYYRMLTDRFGLGGGLHITANSRYNYVAGLRLGMLASF